MPLLQRKGSEKALGQRSRCALLLEQGNRASGVPPLPFSPPRFPRSGLGFLPDSLIPADSGPPIFSSKLRVTVVSCFRYGDLTSPSCFATAGNVFPTVPGLHRLGLGPSTRLQWGSNNGRPASGRRGCCQAPPTACRAQIMPTGCLSSCPPFPSRVEHEKVLN